MEPRQEDPVSSFSLPVVDAGALKPRTCVWELTLECNLRCGHCGSRAGKARADELDTRESLGVVRDLAELGCEVITLSGGEPTLRKDWPVIAEAIAARGMIPNMVTNGVTLTPEVAREMKRVGLSNVAISIDGPREVHERIRGRGTFPLAERAVRSAQEAGLPVTVMTTVNTLNLPHLEAMHELCVALEVRRWRLQLGKPMGNLADHDDWVIRPKELLYLLPRLHRLAELRTVQVGIGDSLGYYGPYDTPLRARSWKGTPQRWGGCQAGLQAIGIEADGGVKGCLSMQAFSGSGADPFREGSVRERPLQELWRDPASFAYNRRFEEKSLGGFCASCRHKVACRGGARCVAAAVTGGLAEDPYCYHRVSELARQSAAGRVRQGLAATGLSLAGLLWTGCPGDFPGNGPSDGAAGDRGAGQGGGGGQGGAGGQAGAGGAGGQPAIVCAEVDCADPATPPAALSECCSQPEYGVDPCLNVCCECDYGAAPPAECCPAPIDCSQVDCADPATPAEEAAACCVTPDYGDEP